METVVRLLAEQLSVRSTFVSHISAETRKFEVVAAFNAPGGCDIPEGTALPLPETFCSTIAGAADLMPLAVPDARTDPHFGALPSQAMFNIGSYLGVPIVLGDGTFYGTLCALDPTPRAFTPHETDLLALLGRLLGSYIENAQLAEERDRQRRAAEERTAELVALLESIDSGVFFVAWPDLRVRFVNRRMSDLFGLDLYPSVGHEKPEWITHHIMGHMARPEAFAGRLTYLYAHPHEIAVDEVEVARPVRRVLRRYSGPVYGTDQALLGRLEIYTDITESKQLEWAKDEFLAVASHDLKTPVTAISGYAQLLQRRMASGQITPERMASSIERIASQASLLTEMMDRLLDMSRIAAGRLEIRAEPVDAAGLLVEVVDTLGSVLARHSVRLDLPDDHPIADWDRDRIRQVLVNLLSNAAKYAPEGTVVEAGLRQGPYEAERGASVEYWVRDEGPGIPADDQPRIFDRFSRTPAALQSGIGGTGLGLHIAKAIVEAHGGRIWVESVPGAGATFRVILPVLPPREGS
jgi:signal transduction histidine kinase